MLSSQYKNIIQWTLCYGGISENDDSISVVRKIFDNLGVALPQGNLDHIVQVLKSKTYMGWTPCTKEDAQRFVNVGVAAIGIGSNKVVIVLPDDSIENFSDDPNLKNIKNEIVKHTNNLEDEKNDDMHFFAYSYGFRFDNT